MAVLKFKDSNGVIHEILSIKGDPGKDAVTDQTYNPESPNAQSGIAVAEAIDKSISKEPIDLVNYSTWEQGSILQGVLIENTPFRIRTKDFIDIASYKDICFSVESGYKWCAHFFDKDETFVESSGWQTDIKTINISKPNVKKIKFILSNLNDNVEINVSEYKNFSAIATRYFDAELEIANKISQISKKIGNYNPFILLHFSDIHGDTQNFKYIVDFASNNKSYIDDIIHTGDSVAKICTDDFTFWGNIDTNKQVLNCIGNHDVWNNYSTGTYGLTESETYIRYMADFVDSWGVTYNNNHNYYYKDYSDKKIRLIVLDCMFDTQEQQTWFTNTLNDAKENDYHVIIASHIPNVPLDGEKINVTNTPFCNPYLTKKWTLLPYERMNIFYPSSVDSFIGNGGNFVCWLYGHRHYNVFGTLKNYENQTVIVVSNAAIDNARCLDMTREKGTNSQHCFNIISIDTELKYIKMLRVGNKYNNLMQCADIMCYDYENKIIVS